MSNKKAIMVLPFVFALLVACTRQEVNQPGESSVSAVNKTTLLQLVNEVRKNGCNCGGTWYDPAPAVTWNDQLENAAYLHSKDMSEKNISVTMPPTDRMREIVYCARVIDGHPMRKILVMVIRTNNP